MLEKPRASPRKNKIILDSDTNYIVSGFERSGTSMMMQVLAAGGVPIAYDDTRRKDQHNQNGYFELYGGKIINKLIDNTLSLSAFHGKFIKITAYGLLHLPVGKYKIIYLQRNIEEILDSMECMMQSMDYHRIETRQSLQKLNSKLLHDLSQREDLHWIQMNYNSIIEDPVTNIQKIKNFIGPYCFDTNAMIQAVDKKLYRQRKKPLLK